MDHDNREEDKKFFLVPEKGVRKPKVSLDVVKSIYIAEGLSPQEIANRYDISVNQVQNLVDEYKLPELRKAYLINGIKNIQNTQIQQSEKLMNLDNGFKKLRIIQLEKQLEDYILYYERHGHLSKLHPITHEILIGNDGMPIQIVVPNVAKEISQLRESVTMSEGVKQLLNKIDDILNQGVKLENVNDGDILDIDYKEIFKDTDVD